MKLRYVAVCEDDFTTGHLFETYPLARHYVNDHICVGEKWSIFSIDAVNLRSQCFYEPAPIVVPKARKVWS
jgi:hypothetical protein